MTVIFSPFLGEKPCEGEGFRNAALLQRFFSRFLSLWGPLPGAGAAGGVWVCLGGTLTGTLEAASWASSAVPVSWTHVRAVHVCHIHLFSSTRVVPSVVEV